MEREYGRVDERFPKERTILYAAAREGLLAEYAEVVIPREVFVRNGAAEIRQVLEALFEALTREVERRVYERMLPASTI